MDKMKLGMEVGLGPGHIVLDGEWGTQLPPKKGARPQFSAHVHNMAKRLDGLRCHLVRVEGRGPGDIVLDGDPAPQKAQISHFWPMYIVVKRLDAPGYHLVRR